MIFDYLRIILLHLYLYPFMTIDLILDCVRGEYNRQGCALITDISPYSYSQDGDIIFGGILQIFTFSSKSKHDFSDVPEPVTCFVPSLQYLRHLFAFIYAVEEINNSAEILPNITLGFQIYDSCTSEVVALVSTFSILSERPEPILNFICQKRQKTVAFIGHVLSSASHTIAGITQLYGYPQVSYGALDPIFNDRVRFPAVYRTVPNEYSQFKAIIQLLTHFEWTWVGIITSDDDSNLQASEELSKQMRQSGICVPFLEKTPKPTDGDRKGIQKLNHYLKNVQLKTSSGVVLNFDENGNMPGMFDVIIWNVFSNERITKTQTPLSRCSIPCSFGFRIVQQKGKTHCCYQCIPCPDGEIANVTDMLKCLSCPEDQWSNPYKAKCIQRIKEFLSYRGTLGATLSSIASIFLVITVAVLFVFVKFRRSPLVRANDRNLSYILLLSLILSFLCSFLFIGYPMMVTCMLRQVAFGFIFTVAVSSVLGKTVTIIIAFNATKPNSTIRKWIGSRISISLILLFSFGELLICIIWLTCSPPFVDTDTKTFPGKIIIQCNEGSFIAFYAMISYIGILALFSFILAFLVRKLPDSFNDAQYITFSMLVFCSVWISFIPIYLSSKGKYVVAVEIFTILASTGGLLICIFAPKCYIILIKPELNKKHLLKPKL
ncbi:vomeronasal type-2 receptor 26 [Xenopus laevis]|uniref:Vomeronasal type-2 receptor 26 n=1 Tax=Xenopus laevis TaxID=8355 RepID=A0A8J1LL77_XENLA|nr:vomeronasal type-2 receptor 26 [Xenopus laevis]